MKAHLNARFTVASGILIALSGAGHAVADDSIVDPDDAAQTAIEAARAANEAAGEAAEAAGEAAQAAGEAAQATAEEEEKGPWDVALSVGANGAATYVRDVVGASSDGTTFQLGVVIHGGADWTHGRHSVQNSLDIQNTRTKTPQLELFVKSADLVTVDSTYLYGFEKLSWLGPFGRFKATTSLFPGYEVYSDPVVVAPPGLDTVTDDNPIMLDDLDETTTGEVAPQQKIPLTGAFEPLVMRQSGGLFANPVDETAIKVKTKLGAGLQETITQGGYVNANNPDTPEIEYTQLANAVQAGGELGVELSGTARENLTWSAKANFFLPFVTSNPDAPAGVEGLDSDLGVNVGVKLAKWASLDYAFSARRVPTVSEDWQIQTGIMLSASFNVIE